MSMRGRKSDRQPASSAAGLEQNGATEDESRADTSSADASPDDGDPPAVGTAPIAAAHAPAEGTASPVLEEARERAGAGDIAAAIEAYRGYILSASDTAQARLELARLYETKSEWQLALEQYEAAREEADGLEATLGVAASLAALGKFEAAERELRRAAKSHPSSAQVFATSGTIAFRRGLYTEAEQDLKRAIDLDPENGYAYFYRGESLNQLSRVDEALEMLERATQLLPSLGRAYYVMGILFDKKGRPQEAAAMYRKAREVAAA